MAKKNVIIVEGKTIEQIKAELESTIDKHNSTEVVAERIKLKVAAEKFKEAYNKASMHTAYADCLGTKNPMLALIQAYKYPVVSVGADRETGDLTLKSENNDGSKLTEVFNLWNFVEFCESINKQVVASLDWKSKANAAKKVLLESVQKYIDNGTEMDVGGLKNALQEMYNSIVKFAGKNGNNAIIETSKHTRLIYVTCGRLDTKSFVAKFGTEKSWQKTVFAFLHAAIEGKDFSCIYGEDDTKTADTNEEADEVTEETK